MEPDPAVSQAVTLADLRQGAKARHLKVMGVAPDGAGCILLLGPDEPWFWPTFTAAQEYTDGAPDPMDRWSKRVIGAWAQEIGAAPIYPSDGPPYPSFYQWALDSAEIWSSPPGLLVSATEGLWVSFRGALRLPYAVAARRSTGRPCTTCSAPCLRACPVQALSEGQYDVDRCRAHIAGEDRAQCRAYGCAARRACPAGVPHLRPAAQSAFHMQAFMP